jgi:hypothetical protein
MVRREVPTLSRRPAGLHPERDAAVRPCCNAQHPVHAVGARAVVPELEVLEMTTPTLREAAQAALEALEDYHRYTGFQNRATEELRASLAAPEPTKKTVAHSADCLCDQCESDFKYRSATALAAPEPPQEPVQLERWGFASPAALRPSRMADGYWTPWHLADAALRSALSREEQ